MNGVKLFSLMGKLAIDGVDKAKNDLQDVSKESNKTAKATKQLGATYSELKDDVKASEERLSALKDEYSNVVLQQGKNSKSAKELEAEMKQLNKGIEEDKRRLKEAESASKSFTTQIGKSASEVKTAGEKFQDLGKKAGELGTKMAKGLLAFGTGIVATVEASREMREDFGKLDTAFKTTGSSTETANKVFKELYGTLGENDRSIEAANHLAMLTNNEKDLSTWTDICTGIYATFGDSLPIEGLTEAANETAKTGELTGVLADALNWAGISEDSFQEKLDKCNTEAEREKLIRETLNNTYKEASDTYKNINGDVIDNNKAQADLNKQLADATAKIEPLITKGKIFLVEVLEKAQPLITWVIDNINILAPIILTFIGSLFSLNIATKIMNFIPIVKSLFTVLTANPIGLIITAIGLLVLAFIDLWNNSESFRNFWKSLWEGIKNIVSGAINFIVEWFNKIVNFVKDNWQGLLLLIVNPFAGAFKLLYDNCEGFRNFVDKWIGKIKDFFVNGFNSIKEKVTSTFTNLKNGVVNIATNIKDGVVNKITSLKDGVVNRFNSIKDGATNVFNKVKTAITSPIEKARDVVKGVVDKIKGFFNFKVELPKIKLPKFGITPSGWKIGDLLKGSIPKLSIKWNKEGAIFNKPTIFDTRYGFQGAGEDGAEAIAPISKLMDYTRLAVEDSNAGLEDKLDNLIKLLQYYLPFLKNMKLVMDTGALVGEIVDPMDKALAEKSEDRKRGR